MKKRFVALARVSSREQKREGFSLDIQEQALRYYAEHAEGVIDKLYRIAETASKYQERATFKEMMAYVKKNAASISGLYFIRSIVRPGISSTMLSWSDLRTNIRSQ